ncbi:bacteriorhodopsin [Salinibacterium sp.]|uniref:bacteriorhodopsin n=1 Tax=Salinibacterium sp. TaxID=1915057 RepID=UPI00286D120D|nr:bacteriorhodopsin [Salinibacterium sp.]
MLPAPWEAPLTESGHQLILYFLGLAFLVLGAGFVRAIATRGEVGARYRSATVARLAVLGTASLSYLFLLIAFVVGYDSTSAGWSPNEFAVNTFSLRYVDWSLTVPLLCAELLAVTTLIGVASKRALFTAIGLAFGMIFTGFLGGIVVDGGTNPGATLAWFGVSIVFWALTNVVLIRAVRASIPGLTPEAGRLITNATILLLSGWVVYPVIAIIQVFTFGGEWTTTIQVVLCIADIVVKVGFSTIILDVAKLRTAEDVRSGEDLHPEAIWISSIKQSDAGLPPQVFLEQSRVVHAPRSRPPASSALGMSAEEALDIPDPSDD